MLTIAALAALLPGARLAGDGSAVFTAVSTDTRTLAPGSLFVALRGPTHDGHDHAAAAVQGGAVGLIVERALPLPVPQVVVPDARRALGQGAAAWRTRFRLPVIGVTGSNGKTSVTQMIAAILGRAFGSAALATRGNLNNDIGVPLMAWQLRATHRAAVLELGTNHPGEIALLAAIAHPTVGLVNNAQREHQAFFGSVEGSARENAAVIAALPPDGIAVFPADDACAPIWRRAAGTRRVLDFALDGPAAITAQADLHADGCRLAIATPGGVIDVDLQVPGRHQARNALAAAAATLAIDVPPAAIAAGLGAFAAVSGRGVRRQVGERLVVVDDTYNANPDSMRAAVDLLADEPLPTGAVRVLVVGDMGEVGDDGPAFHAEIGAWARQRGIDRLLAFGPASADVVAACTAAGGAGEHFTDIDALVSRLRALIDGVPAAVPVRVLVKGSRSMRMERVVAAIAGDRPAAAGH